MSSADELKDYFSDRPASYARHRPFYPDDLFEFLGTLVKSHDIAFDCATGSGQAAIGLVKYFSQVFARDISQNQLGQAFPHERITYRICSAEETELADSSLWPGGSENKIKIEWPLFLKAGRFEA